MSLFYAVSPIFFGHLYFSIHTLSWEVDPEENKRFDTPLATYLVAVMSCKYFPRMAVIVPVLIP